MARLSLTELEEPQGAEEQNLAGLFGQPSPLPSPGTHSAVQTEINPLPCCSAPLSSSSCHPPHSLSFQSPPPVLHPSPQAHIARNPITSHEGKASLIPPLFSHFNPLPLKLLFLSSCSQWIKKYPPPLRHLPLTRVTLSWVSVTSWPLLSGPLGAWLSLHSHTKQWLC